MKTKKAHLGLSILAGSMSFVGSASALDLVIDGSYESSTNSLSGVVGTSPGSGGEPEGGWTAFTSYTYAANYTQPGPAGCGQVYLRPYGGPVSQTVTLARAITGAQIDSTTGAFNASAWFSTYLGQNDYSTLTLQFLDVSMVPVGNPITLGGATFVAAIPGGSGPRAWAKDTRTGVVPVGSRYATITTVATAMSGQPDGYVDLVSLDVTAGFVPVSATLTPANGSTGVGPAPLVRATLADGSAPLNPASIGVSYDGAPVTPSVSKTDNVTTIEFAPSGVWGSLSTHTFSIAYGNTGGATANTTNQSSFTVAPYVNVDLGAPVYLETFDSLAEGTLPAGWSVINYTDQDIPGLDLNNFHSDSYLDWVVVSRSSMTNVTTVIPGGEDFLGVFNVAPNQVINGAPVNNLIETNFIFAASDRGPNDMQKQIQYLFTGDYNLSGKANVYLAFNNIYVQNQDSLGSVEYSINGGATWLPAVYFLHGPDILTDASGLINASNTFAAIKNDVADIDAGTLTGGHYGRYIGVNSNQWSTLAPYLGARSDDDQTSSKRVEVIRLAQADNQPAVRLRFAQVALYSWYFGVDNVGFYSIPSAPAPLLLSSPTPTNQTVAVGNSATITIGTPLGLGPFTYQWRQNGTDLSGKTSPSLLFPVIQTGNAGSYDVVVTGPGGSVTSAAPAVLTVINPPVFVTGQWDFNGNLAATYGRDLEYFDATVTADTTFGTAASFGMPDIGGQPTTVMHITPSTAAWGGYKMYHGAAPNGGGSYVNQYTLIYDILYTSSSSTWRSLLQTGTGNTADGDLFLNPGNGIGISSVYEGFVAPDAWHRIAVAFDLAGPGQAPVLTKFIDGVKVGNQTGGLSNRDGRFALDPYALLFADQDGDVAEGFVSSIQFSDGRRPDAYIAGLGGPSAAKIPGVIKASKSGANVVITWTGGVPLESAPAVTGPWTIVNGATSPYPTPATGTTFYRPKLF